MDLFHSDDLSCFPYNPKEKRLYYSSFSNMEAYKTHCNTQDHIASWHLYKLNEEEMKMI